jgi:hypothetical protein
MISIACVLSASDEVEARGVSLYQRDRITAAVVKSETTAKG